MKGLKGGLFKTKISFGERVRSLLSHKKVSNDFIEGLEEALITADIGVDSSLYIIDRIKRELSGKELGSEDIVKNKIKDYIYEILKPLEAPLYINTKPYCIMCVGVNGVGKTTVIGKLAHRLRNEGKKVILAASDTFRAAAVEQLEEWGKRTGAELIKHSEGGDPGAVAFDAVTSARSKGADIVIVDTAGRLHTRTNLMDELKKVKRVIGKSLEGAPHEVLLTLDATTGNNAIQQAVSFKDTIGVTGIVLTKLDGTARGGILVAIGKDIGIPIRYIGVGEKTEDLIDFNAKEFSENIL